LGGGERERNECLLKNVLYFTSNRLEGNCKMSQSIVKSKGAILCNSNFFRLSNNIKLDNWNFYKCTTLTSFKLNAEALSEDTRMVIVAGLDSIIAEARTANEVAAIGDDFISVISILHKKKFSITVSPVVIWKNFTPAAKDAAKAGLAKIKEAYPDILVIDNAGRLLFETDGVHLQENCARKLLDSVLKQATAHSTGGGASNADLETEDETVEMFSTPLTGLRGQKKGLKRKETGSPSGSMVTQLVNDVKKIRQDIDERRILDYMVFARHQEELDQIENEKKLNCLILHGLEIPDIFKTEKGPARDTLIKAAVALALDGLAALQAKDGEPPQAYTVRFVRHLNAHLERMKPPRQVIEVRLGSPEEASFFKKSFGTLSKSWRATKRTPSEFSGMGVTGSVTKETRVRIEVLTAIAKCIKANSNKDAFVIQHLPRPLLKVIDRSGSAESARAFGYTEAIAYLLAEHRGKLQDQDLAAAYSKAGNKYGPEITHYFVVLKGRDARINI